MLIKKGKWGEQAIWECDVCKKHFQVTRSRAGEAVKKNHHKFCSKNCKETFNKEVSSKRVIDWVKINGHPRFNGGIGITTDGYIWIRVEGNGYHHNQVKLHRYLMEIKLGRKLLDTEIVHHINGNKFDNRIENLTIVSRTEHNKIHEVLRR